MNLLGAHLDYNEGFVMPVAVDRGTYVLARPRGDGVVRIASLDREPEVELPIEGLRFDPDHGWANYPKGALAAFEGDLEGIDCLFAGNLPIGAGLSSSASILVATAVAASALARRPRSLSELVELCHGAETGFVGVKCGIMDHYASVFGRRDHVMHLDCRTNRHSDVPFDSGRAVLVVCDSTLRRELTDGRFNDRVRECEAAVESLRAQGIDVAALRDATLDDLDRARGGMDPVVHRRARHVVEEIERTAEGARALRSGDLEAFGLCLVASHRSCRDLYEVSSRELDLLVDAAMESGVAYGSRLTGAGFGGCTVAIVRVDGLEDFRREVSSRFLEATGREVLLHVVHPADGAGALGESPSRSGSG